MNILIKSGKALCSLQRCCTKLLDFQLRRKAKIGQLESLAVRSKLSGDTWSTSAGQHWTSINWSGRGYSTMEGDHGADISDRIADESKGPYEDLSPEDPLHQATEQIFGLNRSESRCVDNLCDHAERFLAILGSYSNGKKALPRRSLEGLTLLGQLCYEYEHYEEARKAFLQALVFHEIRPVPTLLPRAINGLAMTYMALGEPQEASQICESALALAKSIYGETSKEAVHIMVNLVQLYQNLEDQDVVKAWKARVYEAIGDPDEIKQMNLKPGHAQSLFQAGNACFQLGDFDKARKFFELHLGIAQTKKNLPIYHIVESLRNLAIANEKLGNVEESLQILKDTVDFMKANHLNEGATYAETCCRLGLAAVKMGDSDTAKSAFSCARAHAHHLRT
eukprot:CAMPEP_0184489158 /NCGR_PEP_ID=MMETSP0113_2-20130426/14626_1 /TAXON_ID=91329 /ORGANISM="Norrisiella sphaerica, Strain BC52" /LENGTH=393 /DNA_ID=CAMNT_0026872415 /DNA_START=33 /DNA_END=1210 /DNA_ORIENTATION=+